MEADGRAAAIIVAAGQSTRFGGDVPKVYQRLDGQMMLEYSIRRLRQHPLIGQLLVVVNPEHETFYDDLKQRYDLWTVAGGATRQESVYNGLDALADAPPDWVLVHDGARPYLSDALIDRLLEGLADHPAVIPALPVTDTVKQVEGGAVARTLPRESLIRVQTPQAFHYAELLAAHIAADHTHYTDDAAVMEAAGMPVSTVPGDGANQKITRPEDLASSCHSVGTGMVRVGTGFDVHRLIENPDRPLMICGVEIPETLALEGHSDADVGLHALVDAILGAMGEGDIGEHFPPSDAQWAHADSRLFVAHCLELLQLRGGRLHHIDVTIIAERPRLKAYKTAMREVLAELCALPLASVNIKATTTEGLGFTGRVEGIAAQAVVSVQL